MKKVIRLVTCGFILIGLTGCAKLAMVNMPDDMKASYENPSSSSDSACPDCKKPLSYISDYKRWYCESEGKYMPEGFDPAKLAAKVPPPPPAPKAPPIPAKPTVKDPCPDCGKTLTYIDDYKRWYCDSEAKYMPEGFAPGASVSAPARVSSDGGNLVFGFEQLSNYSGSEDSQQAVSLDSQFNTEGSACFRVEFQSGDYPGFEIYNSGFSLSDWSGRASMLMDVYNPNKDLRIFSIIIDNEARERYIQDEIALKNGPNTVKIDLRRTTAKLKSGMQMRQIVFYVEPGADPSIPMPFSLYFDNLRLE